MTTKGRNNLCGEEGGIGKGERGEGEKEEGISWFSKIIIFQWTANEGGGGVEGGAIRIFRSLMLVGGGGGEEIR